MSQRRFVIQEVIGYELNPKTGLMKAIYKDCGPVPAQWNISNPNRVLRADLTTTKDRRSESKILAQRVRRKKREENEPHNQKGH